MKNLTMKNAVICSLFICAFLSFTIVPSFAGGGNLFDPRNSRPVDGSGSNTYVQTMDNYVCGDLNGDGELNILDYIMLHRYVLLGGPAPRLPVTADINRDDVPNILDVIWLLDYLFRNGPLPFCPDYAAEADFDDNRYISTADIKEMSNVAFGGQLPKPGKCYDWDENGVVDIIDVTYAVNFFKRGGFPPVTVKKAYAYCADFNKDKKVNLIDISALQSYVFEGGKAPLDPASADFNGDQKSDVLDVVGLIDYLYRAGAAPTCAPACGDGICNGTETYTSCLADCPAPPPPSKFSTSSW